MGFLKIPEFSLWWDFSIYTARLLSLKVIFLVATIMLAVHARFRIILNLNSNNLVFLSLPILDVTLLALLFYW